MSLWDGSTPGWADQTESHLALLFSLSSKKLARLDAGGPKEIVLVWEWTLHLLWINRQTFSLCG